MSKVDKIKGIAGLIIIYILSSTFIMIGKSFKWFGEGEGSEPWSSILIIPNIVILCFAYHNRNRETSMFRWNKYGNIIVLITVPCLLVAMATIIQTSDVQLECVSLNVSFDSDNKPLYMEDGNAQSCGVPDDNGNCTRTGCFIAHPTQGEFWKSPKMLIGYCFWAIGLFIVYEIGLSEGKTAGIWAGVAFVGLFITIGIILTFIFNIGDPIVLDKGVPLSADQQAAGIEVSELDRSSYWFKGGISDPFSLKSISVKKGSGGVKELERSDGSGEDREECPEEGVRPKFLWKCGDKTNNRYEPKCMGDWWVSSSKGGYEDEFKSFYRFIYILITFTLVILSLFPSINKQSGIQGAKYIIAVFGCILMYFITYLITNIIVSWTYGSPILFEQFISEYMKGIDGSWMDNNLTHDQSIWDNDSVASKFKIIIHVILFIVIIVLLSGLIGQRFILYQVEADFDGVQGRIFSTLIGILLSLIALLVIFSIFSTILVDKCIIDRITNSLNNREIECKGINEENNEDCEERIIQPDLAENETLESKCISGDGLCEYIDDHSFNIKELFRCALDGHGGLLYHLILMIIPPLFLSVKNSRFMNYLM